MLSARTKAIALESRRDAWRDSAILSQRSASELARQVDQQAAELARLRAENEQLKAGARPYTVTCEPVIDRDWPEAHSDAHQNGGQRFDIGMHLETLEEARALRNDVAGRPGIDAAMAQGRQSVSVKDITDRQVCEVVELMARERLHTATLLCWDSFPT